MANVKPITLNNDEIRPSACGRFGVIDGFLAVIDGHEDLLAALKTARELIQNPQFQAVAVVRDSQSLEKSFSSIAGMMDVDCKFGNGAIEGRIMPWPQKNKYLYLNRGMLTINPNKTLRYGRADKNIGTDFHEVFTSAREVFPEYLSWSVRRLKSGVPGALHYDECYRPGLRSVLDLPKKFAMSVNDDVFMPLAGSITMTMSLANGGTIICNTNEIRQEQNFYKSDLTGYQGQDGDLLILRAKGWNEAEGYRPAFHCPPSVDSILSRRFVAVASSNTSYLSPQVREFLGRSRLPCDDPFEVFLDDFDNVRIQTSPQDLKLALLKVPAEILKRFPRDMLDRFPEETRANILPVLDAV